MLYNNLKIAWRSLQKSKLYSSINIFGLSIGLAACLLIGLYVSNEFQYDKFHENVENIVRVTLEYSNSGQVDAAGVTGTKVGPEFKRTFPDVEEYVRTFISNNVIKKGSDAFEENRILYADPAFFQVFTFNFISGNPSSALDSPDKIVLTESMVKKYFGEEDPMGQILRSGGKDLTISGVCLDPPQNSQIKFDFVTQFFNLGNNAKNEIWWSANWVTYLLLNEGTEIVGLENQINEYMDSEAIREQTGAQDPDYLHFHLESMASVHLYSEHAAFEPNGSIRYLYIFGIIALLILIIATANYTNLAIAQSIGRGSEIGTRKVMGASKKQIFWQFISESTLVTGIATIGALIVTVLLIPFFNRISGKSFVFQDVLEPLPIVLILLFALFVSFVAGLYPAVILARTKIMDVLKSKNAIASNSGSIIRKSLIVVQFTISLFLISVTTIIMNQLNFIKKVDLGYDRNHVLVMPIGGSMKDNQEILKDAFENVPGVVSVTSAYETPEFVEWGDGITVVGNNGEMDISLTAMPVALDYAKTLGMEFAAGRDFNQGDFSIMDTTNKSANYRLPYIINETLAEMIGWTPEEAIGKTIENRALGPVVGVVEDFHFTSLHEPVGPIIQFLSPDFSRVFMAKVSGNDLSGTLSGLEKTWNARVTDRPFNYHFLDEDFDKLYASEERSTALLKSASLLAIFLAALGLFGLAAFVIIKRTKEIGIRRVLGASISSISVLFVKQFLWLVLIAILISIPLAYIAGNRWLQDFAYKIDITWWHFAFAALFVTLIAVGTISYHAIKACFRNPVNSLRTE